MGWSSGSDIMLAVIRSAQRLKLKPAVREQLYRDVYAEMSAHDWDTECEAMDIDPIFDNLMFELHPGWSEDDDA